MTTNSKKSAVWGILFIFLFILWTASVQNIDVKPLGVNGTEIGFSEINIRFHNLTGVNMRLYFITDWLSVVPLLICMIFALAGLIQLIKRKSLLSVDRDIIISGVYYAAVIFCYLIFELYPINYRPILIDGIMETSYPSSTTLLVLCVLPTLRVLIFRRSSSKVLKISVALFVYIFSAFTVLGRVLSGVHWLSDIVGSMLLCIGLYNLYKAVILISDIKSK